MGLLARAEYTCGHIAPHSNTPPPPHLPWTPFVASKTVMPARFPSINETQLFCNLLGCRPCGMNHKLVPTCRIRLPLQFGGEPRLLFPIHPPLPPCDRFTYICGRNNFVLFTCPFPLWNGCFRISSHPVAMLPHWVHPLTHLHGLRSALASLEV